MLTEIPAGMKLTKFARKILLKLEEDSFAI